MNKLVYALFWEETSAAKAVDALVDADFEPAEISVLMREGAEIEALTVKDKSGVPAGAAIGAALGAVGGALFAPAIGFLAAGPLLAGIEGALAAGTTGSVVGALAGLGFWWEKLEFPHEHLEKGAILVGVSSEERTPAVRQALLEAGATEVHERTRVEAIAEVWDAHQPDEPERSQPES